MNILKRLPKDIENIILSYKAQLEHHNKFESTLKIINDIHYSTFKNFTNMGTEYHQVCISYDLYDVFCRIIFDICTQCGEYHIRHHKCACHGNYQHCHYNTAILIPKDLIKYNKADNIWTFIDDIYMSVTPSGISYDE